MISNMSMIPMDMQPVTDFWSYRQNVCTKRCVDLQTAIWNERVSTVLLIVPSTVASSVVSIAWVVMNSP